MKYVTAGFGLISNLFFSFSGLVLVNEALSDLIPIPLLPLGKSVSPLK
jgi:hypothetical protein